MIRELVTIGLGLQDVEQVTDYRIAGNYEVSTSWPICFSLIAANWDPTPSRWYADALSAVLYCLIEQDHRGSLRNGRAYSDGSGHDDKAERTCPFLRSDPFL